MRELVFTASERTTALVGVITMLQGLPTVVGPSRSFIVGATLGSESKLPF